MIWNLIYRTVRMGMEFSYHVYVRSFQINQTYKEKRIDHVIYVANHGNAFFDAFSIIYSQQKIPVFLTRAGVFKSKIGGYILRKFFMLPIYRQRDGIKSVSKNNEIMSKCVEYLNNGRHPIGMFPEGNHNMKLGLRPLQKGISRMAFEALDKYPDMDLKIIPIGINYSSYMSFKADVFVNKGEPLFVKPFYEIYKENKIEGTQALMNELKESMSELSLSIPNENYDEIYQQFEKVRSRGRDLKMNFEQDKEIIKGLINGESYPETIYAKQNNSLLWIRRIFALPLYLIGLISNFFPELILKKMVKKTVSDPHFHDSIAVSIGFFLYSITYLLQAVLLYFIIGNAAIAIIYLILIPFISKLYYAYLYRKQ